ncbi:heat shock protein Lhs1 [Schizosaccharomyces japonicus yFS275]|uniref:Heat shock protein Lhs1 n=1 Tax=Schizosaccharomyces japonicus (strain yFS275 / FY16936) TaxID=402676 RepID=B6K1F0_SCHJY|nr:heat shock protein Lhs1 [Schizosaccharomyces japonicus yFS275]EEB07771.1 heat shock protein Lhs1 [Schizosaccharomyces japonicus yFS275]
MRHFRLAGLLFTFLQLFSSVNAAILAIDYGTQWTKAALVKPGIPLEMVLTRDSRRKEQSAVGFKEDTRLFGTSAANLASRVPEGALLNVKELVGVRNISDSLVEEYQAKYPAVKIEYTDASPSHIAFNVGVNQTYTLEEVIAMQFENYIELAEEMAKEKIFDIVLTTPPEYSNFERQVLLNAVHLLKKRVVATINDGLSVAVNYALSHSVPESETYHIIYDSGAGSTSASLIAFDSVPEQIGFSKNTRNITRVRVLSSAVEQVGGNMLNQRLVEHMIEYLLEERKIDVRHNPRSLARLAKEAVRVKHILSANNEAVASVEDILPGVDFRMKITRAEFESMTDELKNTLIQPIHKAIELSGKKIADVASVILTGGNSRVPFVQAVLAQEVGASKLAKSVNADEASVMGAVFYGATMSKQYRVKPTIIEDVSPSSFSYKLDDGQDTIIIPPMTPYGNESIISFAVNPSINDTLIELLENGEAIANVTISSISEAAKNLTCEAYEAQLGVRISAVNGLLRPFEAALTCASKEKHQGLTQKIKSILSADGNLVEKEGVSLSFMTEFNAVLTPKQRRDAIKKLTERTDLDRKHVAHEMALNELESYLYRVQYLVGDADFLVYGKDYEVDDLKNKSESYYEWLLDTDSAVETSEVLRRLEELQTIVNKIAYRQGEAEKFPSSLEKFTKALQNADSLLESFDTPDYPISEYDENDVKKVFLQRKISHERLSTRRDTEKQWLESLQEQHSVLQSDDDPIITTKDLDSKAEALSTLVRAYLRIALTQPKKKAVVSTLSTSQTSVIPDSESTPGSKSETDANGDANIPTSTVTAAVSEEGPHETPSAQPADANTDEL